MTVADGTARLCAPAPGGGDLGLWQRVIDALRTADQWGSSDSTGTPEIWAHITEGQR
ncbi:hypothetical protein ACF1BE_19990 [Streptomyces sp. NPDC014991]|uniref:hypothetical protein n=1 Tax=Streptomyces sp. NPDC014991 TaxID=3364935 RepID=UPI0036F7B4FD